MTDALLNRPSSNPPIQFSCEWCKFVLHINIHIHHRFDPLDPLQVLPSKKLLPPLMKSWDYTYMMTSSGMLLYKPTIIFRRW